MFNKICERIAKKKLKAFDIQIQGDREWDIQIHDPSLYLDCLLKGSVGLGEGYMDEKWSCKNLEVFMEKIFAKKSRRPTGPIWSKLYHQIRHSFAKPTIESSKQVIDEHYNRETELFQNFLDPEMLYTCAYWRDCNTLHEAQIAKLDRIAQKLQLEPGMRILEVGFGWGAAAEYFCKKYGVIYTGINLCPNHVEYAKKRCEGLLATFILGDWRELPPSEPFDRIVYIGVLEHMGHNNYDENFRRMKEWLKPDGLALIHTIGKQIPAPTDPWIHAHIFPDGEIPILSFLAKSFAPYFILEDLDNFGPYYDKTLMAWLENLQKNKTPFIKKFGTAEYNKYVYYLTTCAIAFRSRNLQLWQMVFSHGRQEVYPRIK